MRSPLLASIFLVSFLLAAALGAFFLLQGVVHRSPLDALPADTRLVLHCPDLDRLWRDLDRTGLSPGGAGALTSVEQRSELVSELLGLILPRWRLPLDASPEILAGLSRGEAALALVPVPGEEPGIALLVGAGGSGAWAAKASELERRVPMDARGGIWTAHDHRGQPYAVLWLPEGAPPICVTSARGLIVLTTSRGVMRRVLDTAAGRLDPLRSTTGFRRMRDALGRRSDLYLYASDEWARAAGARLTARLPDPARSQGVARLLGLDGLRGAGLAINARPGLFQERLVLSLEPDRRGILPDLFDAPARAMPPLRNVPGDFPFYASFSFARLDTVYRKLPELLAGAAGLDRQEVRARLSGLEDFFGIDLGRDLLGSLRGEALVGFGAWSAYPRQGPARALLDTPAVANMSLSGTSAIKRILRRSDGLARAAGALRRDSVAGEPIVSYQIAALAPLEPSYRLKESQLLAATSPALLERSAVGAASQETFAARIEASRILRALPGRAHIFLCGDTNRLLDLAGGPASGALTPVPGSMLAALAAVVARAGLPPTAMAARVDQTGLVMDVVSPISPSLLLVLWLSQGSGVMPAPEAPPGEPARQEGEVLDTSSIPD